jgi:hypothetical protein
MKNDKLFFITLLLCQALALVGLLYRPVASQKEKPPYIQCVEKMYPDCLSGLGARTAHDCLENTEKFCVVTVHSVPLK